MDYILNEKSHCNGYFLTGIVFQNDTSITLSNKFIWGHTNSTSSNCLLNSIINLSKWIMQCSKLSSSSNYIFIISPYDYMINIIK